MVLSGGERERLRAHFAIGVEDVAAFVDAPAEVVALADEIDLLPKVLAVVADPDLAGFGIDRDAPGIAEAIGPGFGDDAFVADKGIVGRDTVLLTGARLIDVDAKDLGGEVR